PLFKQDLQKAKLYRLNAITGIADAKTEKLLGSEGRLEDLESEQIETLVGEKTITRTEGDKLELAASLYHLVDGSFELSVELEKVISSEGRLENLELEQIATLVGETTITETVRDQLELAARLYHLVDGSFELAAEIEQQAKPTDLSDLVKVDKTEW